MYQKSDYYPIWLTDEDCGNAYKQQLSEMYQDYYSTADVKLREEKLENLHPILMVVCDVIAYRYLVKHYSNLFNKLHITIEEYIDYKVERIYVTIKNKKDKIEDILSYVYMSFMLSSPRLIYDYAALLGRCDVVNETLPYFKVQRMKYFFIEKESTVTHIIYNFSTVDIDSTDKTIRSDLEKYSLDYYNTQQSVINSTSHCINIKEYIQNKVDCKYNKSFEYVFYILDNWEALIESDYQLTKQCLNIKTDANFSLLDYIRYKYENKQLDLNYNEYLEVLSILNILIKEKLNIF